MNILCTHKKLKTLVASFALHQTKEVGVVATQEKIKLAQSIECICKMQWYTVLMLGLLLFVVIKLRKLKLLRGHMFLNSVRIVLFILDTKYSIITKLWKTAGSIHLFKLMGALIFENVKLKRNKICDIIEIDWKEVNVTLKGNKIIFTKISQNKI